MDHTRKGVSRSFSDYHLPMNVFLAVFLTCSPSQQGQKGHSNMLSRVSAGAVKHSLYFFGESIFAQHVPYDACFP